MRKLETIKTWKLADVGTFFKNSGKAILKGEFLLRLNIGKYFVHILFTFLMLALTIWFSLMIEASMAKVERGRKELVELNIEHTQKTYELVKLTRRSGVNEMLKEMGSAVTEAQQTATKLR